MIFFFFYNIKFSSNEEMLPTDICQHILIFVDFEEYHRICKILHIPLCFNQYFKYHLIPSVATICYTNPEPIELMNWYLSKHRLNMTKYTIEYMMELLIFNGHINIIADWYTNKFPHIFEEIMGNYMNKAAGFGKLEVMKVLKFLKVNYTSSTLRHAIDGGHFDIVKYLVMNGYKITQIDINCSYECICDNKLIIEGYGGIGRRHIYKHDRLLDFDKDVKKLSKRLDIHKYLLEHSI